MLLLLAAATALVLLVLCSVLHLYDNPLEFLPEISPCVRLQHLTVSQALSWQHC